MYQKRHLIPALIVMLLWMAVYSNGQEVLSLSLEDCIIKVLKQNLRVAIETYNPELAESSVTGAKETFMPRFDLSYDTRQEENPSYWWIQGAETVESDYSNYSFSINQQIPTGGSLSLSLISYKSDTNQAFQLINPRYGSTLQLDFSQPLLRNFGFKVSRKEILVAQNNLDISHNQLKSVLLDTIYSVQEAYWNLFYAIENFKVKQQSLELGRDLLAKNKKEVEVGKLAPIEILNAEAVVAQREADILQAETLIKRSEDVLRNLLNLSDEQESNLEKIVPLDKPSFISKKVFLKEAVGIAMTNRPNLKVYKKNVETRELNLSVAKNQMLPGLDLRFSYWSPGISGDRLLYQDDNPFLGLVIGKEKGRGTDSMRDALKLLYKNWTVGLTLSIPLSNFLTKASLAKANLELEQSFLEFENAEKQVLLEVRDAVREIETNTKRVEAYRLARELAEKRLEAEVRKLEVGLTTNYFVLEFQEGLANAKSQEIKSLVDYNLALAKMEKALGTSLENRSIRIDQIR